MAGTSTFRMRMEVDATQAQRAAAAVTSAFDTTRRAAGNAVDSVGGLEGALGGITTAFGMIGGASAVLGAIKSSFESASQAALDAGKFVQTYRENLLELAALRGTLGRSTPELRENLTFRGKTLQDAQSAVAFQKSALGVGQSAIDTKDQKGLISETEFKKLMEMGGSFQAAEKGSADTHGSLVGQLPSLIGHRTTAKEAFAFENKLYSVFQPGGADFGPMVAGYLKNSQYATAGVIDPLKLAAVESMFSVKNREGHSEQTSQFIRATVGSLGMLRGVKVEGDSMKIAEYYKGIGANNQQDPVEIGKRVAADFKIQQAEATKAGQHFNPLDYLVHRGFGNTESRVALMQFANSVNTGEYGTFENLANAKGSDQTTGKVVNQFQSFDPVAHQRKADIADDVANAVAGAGGEEFYTAITKASFAQLKKDGKTYGTYEDTRKDWLYYSELETLTHQKQTQQAKELGIALPHDRLNFGVLGDNHQTKAQNIFENAQAIGAAGGEMIPDFAKMVESGDRQLLVLEKIESHVRETAEKTKTPAATPRPLAPGGPAPGGRRRDP